MNKQEIKDWLYSYYITNYTINDDLSVDVHGDVNLSNKDLTKFPFQFGTIKGYFDCGYNKLTSLEHGPKVVGNFFYCADNQLTSLEHCPKVVSGIFYCNDNLKKDPNYLRWLLAKKLSEL